MYASYFLALLAVDSAALCTQISLPIQALHVLDAPANWEQSGTETESIYASHLVSTEAAAAPQH